MTTAVAGTPRGNARMARRLREAAELLEQQGDNPFRVQAYRRAAETIERMNRPVADILEAEGVPGLVALPTIGRGIAHGIADLVRTGWLPVLERLRGRADPISMLASLPGVGPVLADRIHHSLGIGTLEELELAAHDGRLERVPGVGTTRLEAVRAALADRLQRRRPPLPEDRSRPPVAELLDVDREYRRKARAGLLKTIAPRRFNPHRRSWLPVLHTVRRGRPYTALYSNTARAHRLGRTDDWVVLYYDGPSGEGQATAVTERSGPLRGRRVIRGREGECVRHYGVWVPPDPHAGLDGNGVF